MTNWDEIDAARLNTPAGAADAFLADVLKTAKALGVGATLRNISERVDRSEASVRSALDSLAGRGYNVSLAPDDATVVINPLQRETDAITHDISDFMGEWASFGAVGDNHLCNRHQRLDVLNALYDLYAAEGISRVYNTGNWIDGEARVNRHELFVFGMDAQIDYWIDQYPRRDGITTYFIAGDDHEGWYQQREAVEIGRYAELRAHAAGRTDLVYLGYIEALVQIVLPADLGIPPINMTVMHPGGGSSYAVSYRGQKLVEAMQGGEKPHIVLQGHYHKFNLGYPREVWVFDTGTTSDQSGFMRKKGLQAHVGGSIIQIHRHPRAGVNRIRAEFIPFYDRGFYEHGRTF